ncbi:MAG: vancomycin high temperature exclusion protein [Bacteroidia bacterium]
MKERLSKVWKWLAFPVKLFLFVLLLAIGANWGVIVYAKEYIYLPENVPSVYCGIVLGAGLTAQNKPTHVLLDRLQTGLELYQKGKIKRFLLSGDHGQLEYDEVNTMKQWLEEKGVPATDIFLDHAGFDTYSTMYRAKEVFEVDDAILITQAFHLNRALFLARQRGLVTYGVKADKRAYIYAKRYRIREYIATLKAIYEVLFNTSPKYLGEKIPITGESAKTFDR